MNRADFPVLVTKLGALLSTDFDWSADLGTITVPVLLAYDDADAVRTSYTVRFFERLGGGRRDGGWDGSGMSTVSAFSMARERATLDAARLRAITNAYQLFPSCRSHAMRELTADLFISLDGFASGVNQPAYFGYFGPDLEKWVRERLDEPQIIVMGRVTYEAFAPFAMSSPDEVSARMREIPKVVFSSTLKEPLMWKNTQLNSGPAPEEIAALKQQDGESLRSVGSMRLVRSMFKAGLIDRLRLMLFPVILGDKGREPIFTDFPPAGLELIQTRVLDDRITLLEYRPAR